MLADMYRRSHGDSLVPMEIKQHYEKQIQRVIEAAEQQHQQTATPPAGHQEKPPNGASFTMRHHKCSRREHYHFKRIGGKSCHSQNSDELEHNQREDARSRGRSPIREQETRSNTPLTTRTVEVVNGSIFSAKEGFILHQGNTTSIGDAGIAKEIQQTFTKGGSD